MTPTTNRPETATMHTDPSIEHTSQMDYRDVHDGTTGAFPAAALTTPMFDSQDVAGLVAAIAMTLGPLAAYSLGWGA